MEKGFFNKGFSTRKTDRSNEIKPGTSDKPKSLDMTKEAARQNDGSSSSSRREMTIPDTFRQIGGNTELAEAKVICLGEAHIAQHHKDIVDFINAHAEDGDILLVEGVQADEERDKKIYLQNEARARNTETRSFSKDVKIFGWDNKDSIVGQKALEINYNKFNL